MKKFAFLTAGIAAALCFAACNSTEKQNTAAGAVGNKSACCSEAAKCDAKCTGDAKTCAKTECCKKTDAKAAPGAVSDKKEGCASSCGTTKTSAKSDCSATKAECAATKSDCAKRLPDDRHHQGCLDGRRQREEGRLQQVVLHQDAGLSPPS